VHEHENEMFFYFAGKLQPAQSRLFLFVFVFMHHVNFSKLMSLYMQ
jgi:hypothetical protein